MKRARNIEIKKSYKKSIKTATTETVSEAQKKIDKAARLNVISKNKAAHLKSSLVKKLKGTSETKVVKKASAKKKTTKKSSKK